MQVLFIKSLVFVPIGVVLLPAPGVFAHLFDAVLGLPAHLLLCKIRIAVACGDIAGSPGLDFIGNLHSCCGFEILYDVEDRIAVAGAKVVNLKTRLFFELLQGADMTLRQVNYVDIVPDACSVRRIIVISEDMGMRLFGMPLGFSPIFPL